MQTPPFTCTSLVFIFSNFRALSLLIFTDMEVKVLFFDCYGDHVSMRSHWRKTFTNKTESLFWTACDFCAFHGFRGKRATRILIAEVPQFCLLIGCGFLYWLLSRKWKFFWWGVRAKLIGIYKDRYLDVVTNCAGLVNWQL